MQQITARHLRKEAGWMLVYGLRELGDRASVLKFRRIVRQTIANLCSYSAHRFILAPPLPI